MQKIITQSELVDNFIRGDLNKHLLAGVVTIDLSAEPDTCWSSCDVMQVHFRPCIIIWKRHPKMEANKDSQSVELTPL